MNEVVCYFDVESKMYRIVEFSKTIKYLDDDSKGVYAKDLFYVLQNYLCKFDEDALFRGQAKNWFPIASIFREEYKHILDNESDYYQSVRRDHDIELNETDNIYQILAQMQHYGYPTRLLDVTSNFYKALAFMVESCTNVLDDGRFPCIYIFEPKKELVDRKYIQEHGNVRKLYNDGLFSILIPSNNQRYNIRLHAQSGLFIIYDLKDSRIIKNDEKELELLNVIKEKYNITRLTVKCSDKKELKHIEKRLHEYKYGVDTLYPDMLKRSEYYKIKWRR